MLTYCLKSEKIWKMKIQKLKTKIGRTMLSSKCAVCNKKNWDLWKNKKWKKYQKKTQKKLGLLILFVVPLVRKLTQTWNTD